VSPCHSAARAAGCGYPRKGEGQIYTCLFATEGTDLRDPLRAGASDDIRRTWGERIDRYSELRAEATEQPRERKVEMYHIGG